MSHRNLWTFQVSHIYTRSPLSKHNIYDEILPLSFSMLNHSMQICALSNIWFDERCTIVRQNDWLCSSKSPLYIWETTLFIISNKLVAKLLTQKIYWHSKGDIGIFSSFVWWKIYVIEADSRDVNLLFISIFFRLC